MMAGMVSFLDSAAAAAQGIAYCPGATIYEQADVSASVMYIQKGAVKLSVSSKTGEVAIMAVLGPGTFFGEGCLAGQPVRMGNATAVVPSMILVLEKDKMLRLLQRHADFAERFIAHMLGTNIRIEEDLLDQLFNAS